ncbi:MAG TPA: 4-(cytidine 5'-diphospho)-2-C-methyl-D-erythritol kinase, partial [Candidatus Hydrogenedentes bacterium]|nr:4-(cytidine 5'-diphospho)-2-C-methyl-D-erythritol kinase [Candidatus Hydrogenedentota bacterium]
LALRAAHLLREVSGTGRGARIWIRKRIPVGGGMAGGSTDAAAVLVALNRLWAIDFSLDRLRALALQLGSDVPFCLVGGTAAAGGRGERLVDLPPIDPPRHVVLVFPGIVSRTADVYRHPSLLPSGALPEKDGWTAAFASVLERLRAGRVADVVFNRLETPVFALYPRLREIRDCLLAAGCAAAAVSGSGSTVFGLCETAEAARDICRRMRKEHSWPSEAVSMWNPGHAVWASPGF